MHGQSAEDTGSRSQGGLRYMLIITFLMDSRLAGGQHQASAADAGTPSGSSYPMFDDDMSAAYRELYMRSISTPRTFCW